MLKSSRGFTLIEVVVVIAIIGILATIGIVSYNGVQARSRDSQRDTKMNILAEALEKYYDTSGEYPACQYLKTKKLSEIVAGSDNTALTMPGVPDGTNSIVNCATAANTISLNQISYTHADNSSSCITVETACKNWTITYKEESSGTNKTISSRRNTEPGTVAAPNSPLIEANEVDQVYTNFTWEDVDCPTAGSIPYYKWKLDAGSTLGTLSAPIRSTNVRFNTSLDNIDYKISVVAYCDSGLTKSSDSTPAGLATYHRAIKQPILLLAADKTSIAPNTSVTLTLTANGPYNSGYTFYICTPQQCTGPINNNVPQNATIPTRTTVATSPQQKTTLEYTTTISSGTNYYGFATRILSGALNDSVASNPVAITVTPPPASKPTISGVISASPSMYYDRIQAVLKPGNNLSCSTGSSLRYKMTYAKISINISWYNAYDWVSTNPIYKELAPNEADSSDATAIRQGMPYAIQVFAKCVNNTNASLESDTISAYSMITTPIQTPVEAVWSTPSDRTFTAGHNKRVVNYTNAPCPVGTWMSNKVFTSVAWNGKKFGPHPWGFNDSWDWDSSNTTSKQVTYTGTYRCKTNYVVSDPSYSNVTTATVIPS